MESDQQQQQTPPRRLTRSQTHQQPTNNQPTTNTIPATRPNPNGTTDQPMKQLLFGENKATATPLKLLAQSISFGTNPSPKTSIHHQSTKFDINTPVTTLLQHIAEQDKVISKLRQQVRSENSKRLAELNDRHAERSGRQQLIQLLSRVVTAPAVPIPPLDPTNRTTTTSNNDDGLMASIHAPKPQHQHLSTLAKSLLMPN